MNKLVTHPLVHLMHDLQIRQNKLGEQMNNFQLLQKEIVTLQERALSDPIAHKKLQRLSQELSPLNQQLSLMMNRLHVHFKELHCSLQNHGDQTSSRTEENVQSSVSRRNFI